MKSPLIRSIAIAALTSLSLGGAGAAPYVLSNTPGDGSVSVGVDGMGAFGSSIGADASDAVFDPVGLTPAAAGTSFESGVALRIGGTGARTFLTSGAIGSSGGFANPVVSGSLTSGASSFTVSGLSFSLTQVLTPLITGSTQTGSVLTQTYVITNTATARTSFELLRYLDGDLLFDSSLLDGGGRLFSGSTEILFETDSATGSSASTTFVGITGEGGSIPLTGRYEIDSFAGLRGRIISGIALDDTVTGDGGDADQFVDAGPGYDVTLALRNLFDLDVGATGTYVTRTIFGNGAPDSVGTDLPEPASLALLGIALAGLAATQRRKL